MLKKYVVNGLSQPNSLDTAYPKNLKMNVLKNVSQRSMKTFYKLSDHYKKNKKGVLCQSNEFDVGNKLSKNAKKLLKEIKDDSPRYQEIDKLIEKIKSN